MSRIQQVFEQLKIKNEIAFIPFITAGDPDYNTTGKLLKCLVDSGADIIELGIPFSDPMADGPTIQAASQRALKNDNFSIHNVLEQVKNLRSYSSVPVILFGYYNPFYHYGVERIARDAADAGVDGFLIVDLPPEEASFMKRAAEQYGLDIIFLLAPTSDVHRISLVAGNASGFVYFVSVTGVTGARASLDKELASYIDRIKKHIHLPVGIGFGISTPDHVKEVSEIADAVIVGSAIIKTMEAHLGSPDMLDKVGSFTASLKAATRRSDPTTA